MTLAETEREWAQRANVTYEELAERLKKHGFTETKASIANKLARATMSAHFFLASMVAIGREAVTLEDI
jgi:endonuclease III